jgi:hypothetical protein
MELLEKKTDATRAMLRAREREKSAAGRLTVQHPRPPRGPARYHHRAAAARASTSSRFVWRVEPRELKEVNDFATTNGAPSHVSSLANFIASESQHIPAA